ncbi:WD40-repeat-containing domain protein [Absidia repens]|uniref:WD40-repeat-containing domain protein n=1 Tax=Absidia repens TaxID=90262 RepID=A0A1X2IVN2_9FUNG|nr:WD40-repeat-containing domain protein [Absidia repens]
MLAPCTSFKVQVGIPIFGLGFTRGNQLLLCGGGGAGRSGVKNKLSSFKVDIRRKDLEEEAIYDISSDEDAPMCLAVHPKENLAVAGINASPESMKNGLNENCRLFHIGETEFTLKKAVPCMESKNEDDYQKVARFSKDGSLLATGTTDGMVHVFKYPTLETVVKVQAVENNDVLDVDINDEGAKLTAVTPGALKLISLRGRNIGTVIQTVSPLMVHKKHKLQFRAFRYGSGFTENLAFAVANGIGKSKGSFIIVLDAHTLEIKKVQQASKKPITTFCLSPDGSVIGYGSADFSISLLEASTLRVLTQVKDAHGFSITSMAISPDRRILVSGSADNTCRVVDLPLQFSPASLNPLHTLLLALAVAGVLLLFTTYFNMNDLRDVKDDTISILPVSATTNTIVDYATTTTTTTTFTEAIAAAVPTDDQDKETAMPTQTTTVIAEESANFKEEL